MTSLAGSRFSVHSPLSVFLGFLFAGLYRPLSPSVVHADTTWPGGWINSDTTKE